jgi:ribokinase
MTETPSVFVLGSFVVSCSAKVTRLPLPGESLRAEALTLEVGGKGFNLALGAHRLGTRVDGVLAIGDDVFGQLAETTLTRAGLSPAMVRRYPAATGSGIGFTDADGENCLAVYPGANLLLSAADVRSAMPTLRRARLVLGQFEIGDEPIIEAFITARTGGGLTLLNPSPFRLPDEGILQQTSILVVNRVEANQLGTALGLPVARELDHDLKGWIRALATSLFECGPDTLVVTLGAQGAIACGRKAPPIYEPALVVDTVDTLGAGDAFSAGFASSLIEGRSLADSLRRANACGGLTTRKLGVFDALPTRDELEHASPLC